MKQRLTTSEPRVLLMPLYPSEEQIARAVLGERHKEWAAMAVILERRGLPKVNRARGGRFWPAVEAFFWTDEGLDGPLSDGGTMKRGGVRIAPFAPDGVEDSHGTETQAVHDRRRTRPFGRARS